MTRWGLRKRLRTWLFDQLLGEFANEEPIEAEPEAPAAAEHVEPMADDAPLLDAEAVRMLGRPRQKPSQAAPEAVPLAGSVEERLARFKLR